MFCKNCGTQLADTAKFCDKCGTQTSAEIKAIKAEQEEKAKVDPEKSLKETKQFTAAIAAVAVVIVVLTGIFLGYEYTESKIIVVTATVFFGFIIAVKWYFEIKAQRQWKQEAEEKERGGGRHVL